MRSASSYIVGSLFAAAVFVSAPAQATAIPDGTVSVVSLINPTVNLAAAPANSTYTALASVDSTLEISGSGGFSAVSGLHGMMSGTLDFSSQIGTTLGQSLADFFVFNDGQGGTYNFSLDSVKTIAYSVTTGVSSSISLYLLGSTVDSNLGLSDTPTSLTLSFNSTGSSPYSASATLAVPPAPSVPEPATWAMALMGFGAMGAVMRRRPRTSIAFG